MVLVIGYVFGKIVMLFSWWCVFCVDVGCSIYVVFGSCDYGILMVK